MTLHDYQVFIYTFS